MTMMKPDWHNEVEELTREEALALFKLGIVVNMVSRDTRSTDELWFNCRTDDSAEFEEVTNFADFFYLGDRPQC